MRKSSFVLGAAVLAMLAASPARAQRQLPGTAKPNALMLLSSKAVQEDLKLTDEQVKKATDAWRKQNVERANLRDLDPEERNKKQAELSKQGEQIVAGLLTPEQAKRLRQIALQQQGLAGALGEPEVAKALALTDDQKQKLKDLNAATMKEARQALQPGIDREEARKKIGEFTKKMNEKALELLTAEQKAKWKEMTGTPIKGDLRPSAPGEPRRPQGK